MSLSVILPLVITKWTYDKNDQPLVNVLGLERSLEGLKAQLASDKQRADELIANLREQIESRKNLPDIRKTMSDPNLFFPESERMKTFFEISESVKSLPSTDPEIQQVKQVIQETNQHSNKK